MVLPLNLKVTKRNVTSIEYKWETKSNFAEHTTYYSPVFPADPTQAVTIQWRLKLQINSKDNYVGIYLYALSKHISSICLTYAFTIKHASYADACKKLSEIKTYNFEKAPKEEGWIQIGGWPHVYPSDNLNYRDKVQSILCIIDIVDWQLEVPVGSLFYKSPSCSCPNFETMLTTGKDADITLVSKDDVQKINVHKNILMASSPVFDAMFSTEMSETLNKLVVMDDLDGEVLDELVRFIYTGKVSNLSATAERLLMVADKYELPMLRAICEQEIGANLSVENAARTLVLADMHQASQLRKHTLSFITLHAQPIFATDGWQEIKAKYPNLLSDICESLGTLQPPELQ